MMTAFITWNLWDTVDNQKLVWSRKTYSMRHLEHFFHSTYTNFDNKEKYLFSNKFENIL